MLAGRASKTRFIRVYVRSLRARVGDVGDVGLLAKG